MKITLLAGYRTYITAALTVLGTLAAVLTGETSIQDGLQLAIPAVLAVFVRAGVDNK